MTFEFDRAGHLHSLSLPSGRKVEYILDGWGRRIGRRVDGQLVNGYVYSDALRPAAELDASGKVAARFVYALPSSAQTYVMRDGKAYLVVTNELGTPRLLVDSSDGRVVEQMNFDAWGRRIGDARASLPFGFAGGLVDPDTGLVHFGARDYDPGTKRWTAPDPLELRGGDANSYRYAGGDPVNRIDPLGTRFCDVVASGVTFSAGGHGLGGSVTVGVVTGGTDIGAYFTLGGGLSTPGLGASVSGACLYEESMEPGTSRGPLIRQFENEGRAFEVSGGRLGVGIDGSVNDDGSTSLAGGHVSVGTGVGFGATYQQTQTWGGAGLVPVEVLSTLLPRGCVVQSSA